jgi:protein-disulfide isomerase
MRKKHFLTGACIVFSLVSLVFGVRAARGNPKAIEMEPYKVLGNPEAGTFIAEFSDFACPYCERIRHPLKEVLDAFPNDLKILFKHFPLSIHPKAQPAAEASECAADQGKFWEYHDLLFADVLAWYEAKDLNGKLVEFAGRLALDPQRFQVCLESGAKKEIVARNKREGRSVFVSGTPTLLLNGRKVFTTHKVEDMKAWVQKAIEENKAA